MRSSSSLKRIDSLESLRFVFAMLIFWHHFPSNPSMEMLGPGAVAFFFMLSGFVMSVGYCEKVCKEDFDYKQFIKKRLIRLMPLNLICLLLWSIVPTVSDIVNSELHPMRYAATIVDALMIQSWIPYEWSYFSGNAVAWFLCDIMFCYLLFPLVSRKLMKRSSLLIIFGVYFAAICFIPDGRAHDFIYIHPLFRVVDFIAGMSLYSVMKSGFELKADQSKLVNTIVELGAIAVFVAAFAIYRIMPKQIGYASLFWIPSIVLVFVFASYRNGGGCPKT